MALAAETPIIALHDVDIFISKRQYDEAYYRIIDNSLDFCYPYTVWHWISDYVDQPIPDIGEELLSSLGGSVICRKSSFIDAGMENENCISWGCEDIERFGRWTTLGYKIGRIDGNLFHAQHPRNMNSGIENPYYANNKAEAEKVNAMPRAELEQYIKTWSWVNSLSVSNKQQE
jgi:hypothetical protein